MMERKRKMAEEKKEDGNGKPEIFRNIVSFMDFLILLHG